MLGRDRARHAEPWRDEARPTATRWASPLTSYRPAPFVISKLAKLLASASGDWLQYSDVFTDPEKLLAACEEHLLEGIVSKRKDDPYRSGKSDWIKVKCASWREANKDRGQLFKSSRSVRR